jgi:error-prone DNA polymerase
MIRPYIQRRSGFETPTYAHPDLRPALQETFGVIVYHEQVIRTLAAMAGYTLTDADHVRRHLNDDAMLPGLRADFLERAIARGVDPAAAEQTWDDVAQFASFGFCKAHAAAFAVPTYRSSWLKTHYRAQFLSGILTHDPGMYPRRLLLDDARRAGVPILPLDIHRSEPEYVTEETTDGVLGIRIGFQDVHGISAADIRSVLAGRAERAFRDMGDFLRRTTVPRPVAEALAHAGAFDALPGGRRGHLYEAITVDAPREGDQLTLTDATPPRHVFPSYSDAEVVRAELDVFGLDATRHLVSFYEPLLRDLGVTRAHDLRRKRQGEWVMVAGVKIASQTPAVRSGQRIIFVSLDDATGPIEVTVFPSVQHKTARTVFHAYAMAVWGQLRRSGKEGISVIAEDVWDLLALQEARRDGRLREAMAEQRQPMAPSPGPHLWHASPGSAG